MYCGAIHLSLPPSRISLWTISSCLLFHWLNWENGTPPSATINLLLPLTMVNKPLLFISYILSHPNSVRHGFHLIQWALNLLCSSLKSYLHKHVSPRGCFPAWGLSIPYNIVNLNKTIRENNSKQNNGVSLGLAEYYNGNTQTIVNGGCILGGWGKRNLFSTKQNGLHQTF